MKTFRLFGLALMTVLLSFGFASCSDDDNPVEDPEKLVGEWILVQYKEWGTDEDGDYSSNEQYDFDEYDRNSERLVIKEGSEKGVFKVTYYGYSEYDEKWYDDGTGKVRLDGNKILPVDEDEYDEEGLIKYEVTFSLKDNKLTVKSYYKWDDGSEDYEENTYKKKN